MGLDELVLAVQGGDARAVRELSRRLTRELERFFSGFVSKADASDLSQLTLLVVLRKLPQFEVDPARPFRAWVLAIGRLELKEEFRRRQRRARLAQRITAAVRPSSTGPSSHVLRLERLDLVEEELTKLESHYRRLIEHDLGDGDPEDLADRENIVRASVRTRRFRAYEKLRRGIRKRNKAVFESTSTPP